MKSFPFILIIATLSSLSVAAEETSNQSFAKYDTNNDGTVTFEELSRSKRMEFDKLDRNQDFSVSVEEFALLDMEPPSEFDFFHTANFRSREGALAISLPDYGEQIRQLINRLDTTADNAVSREEYAAAVAEAKAKKADPLAPKIRSDSGPKG